MKWFKHDCDASDDSRIKKLKHKFGMEGYGVFFNTLELIGRKMEKDISSFGYLPEEWDNEALELEFGISSDKVRTMFDYMCKIGLFDKKDNKIYNSKIVTRCDDYTSRLLRLKQFSGVNFEQSPTISKQSPTMFLPDKIRIDKNINKDSVSKDTYESVNTYLEEFNKLWTTKYQVTKDRSVKLKERLKRYSLDQILQALVNLSKSDFHRGNNDRGWKATPDFLIRNDEKVDEWLNWTPAKTDPFTKGFTEHRSKALEI